MNIRNEKSSTPWAIIIFFLMCFPPVGLFLALRKVTIETHKYNKNSRTLSKVSWFLIIYGVISLLMFASDSLSEEIEQSLAGPIGLSIVFIIMGAILFFTSKWLKTRDLKFTRYMNIIDSQYGGYIDDIAEAFPISYEVAYTDLQKMINCGFFEEGTHLNPGSRIIFIPGKTVDMESSSSEIKEDQELLVVKCPNCGATNAIPAESSAPCEYCGSILQSL